MKRLFTAALSAALLLSLALPSSAAGTGRAVDWALYTDITAQINGHPLRSYNVNGSTAVVAEDPRAYLEERGLPLTKVHGDWNQARYPLEELGALPGVQLTASNDHDFELVPDRVDKGRAMALIALLYGVPLGETAAVGDSDNDLSMLRAAGLPIAMGNAPAAVREAAQRTAPSNQEEGVAWAISRCLEENEWERGEKG